jgi:hypothetical protein
MLPLTEVLSNFGKFGDLFLERCGSHGDELKDSEVFSNR